MFASFRLLLLLVLPLCLGVLLFTVSSNGNTGTPPNFLIEWGSEESKDRLIRSSHNSDFFPLSNHFVSQNNKIFCGLASSAMVLNALRLGSSTLDLPMDKYSIREDEMAWLSKEFNPFFGKYTANNVLTEHAKSRLEVLGKPIEIEGVMKSDFGLQLRQLAKVLESHGLDVKTRVVDDSLSIETIRKELAENLSTEGDYVLINYSRKALGQPGGGHISPLGAYDKNSDSFLIMDVNPNRAPWVWASAEAIVAAMRTFDTVENRGYLLVTDSR